MSGKDKIGERRVLPKTVREACPAKMDLDPDAADAVAAVARSAGLAGESFEVMALTWLRPIVDEGLGSTKRGLNRARSVLKFLGGLISGKRHSEALAEAGMTWVQVSAFCHVCPDLKKVYDKVRLIQREARVAEIGEKVEDAAVELATVGEEVYNRQGEVVGRRRNVKAMEMLLPLAGAEYQKAAGRAVAAGGGDGQAMCSLTFNFGGERTQKMEVVEVADAKEG